MKPQPQTRGDLPAAVVVVGLGNIGSHLVPHLARLSEIASVTLIDRDRYTPENLASQDFRPADVGAPKVRAQGRRLRRIAPALRVRTLHTEIEAVPLGRLRADVLLTCLDSRRARQAVSELAVHLGMAWIDAGVRTDGLLARVDVYPSGSERPCMECTWSAAEYESLEVIYDCARERKLDSGPPTGAPSSLGALAAALQALECRRLLADGLDRVPGARQVLLDAAHQKHYVTELRRNPHCRLADHAAWNITRLATGALELPLARCLALGQDAEPGKPARLRVPNRPFVRRLVCPRCGAERRLLRLVDSLRPRHRRCPGCAAEMAPVAVDLSDTVSDETLRAEDRARTLRGIGLQPGDVFGVGRLTETFFELPDERT